MSKDPAILFYTADFLTGTAFFNDEQRGQYIKLLCEQHQNGHIPEAHMINICKSYDNPVIKKFTKDMQGDFFNERMEREVNRRQSYSESRRNNRIGNIDKGKSASYDKTYDKTYDVGVSTHMDTETETITSNVLKSINVSFESFWDLYDKKCGDKAKLIKKWNALSDKDRQNIMDYLPKYKLSQPDKKFRKDPQTFFNNKSWNDEITVNNPDRGQHPGQIIVDGSVPASFKK